MREGLREAKYEIPWCESRPLTLSEGFLCENTAHSACTKAEVTHASKGQGNTYQCQIRRAGSRQLQYSPAARDAPATFFNQTIAS